MSAASDEERRLRLRATDGVGGADSLRLDNDPDLVGKRREQLLDLLGQMADHDDEGVEAARGKLVQERHDYRPAVDRKNGLRPPLGQRPQPGAQPGRHHDRDGHALRSERSESAPLSRSNVESRCRRTRRSSRASLRARTAASAATPGAAKRAPPAASTKTSAPTSSFESSSSPNSFRSRCAARRSAGRAGSPRARYGRQRRPREGRPSDSGAPPSRLEHEQGKQRPAIASRRGRRSAACGAVFEGATGTERACSPRTLEPSQRLVPKQSLDAVPEPTSAAAVPGSKLLDEAEYEPASLPRPGVGSNGSHPKPSNQTSTHVCASWSVTVQLVFRVRPAREPGGDTGGNAQVAEHERHRAGEVLAVAALSLRHERDERRRAGDRRRVLVVRETAAVAQPRFDRDHGRVRVFRATDDPLRVLVQRGVCGRARCDRLFDSSISVARAERRTYAPLSTEIGIG